MKSYAIIGLGRFGTRLATELYNKGADVLVIDQNDDLIETIANHVTRAAVADAKNREVLRELGVPDCDCAVVATASDFASSVLITMNLKALGVPQVICKAHDDTHKEILEKLGADRVIIPERVLADRLAANLTTPNVLEHIELSQHHGIMELKAPKSWEGQSLRDLNVRARHGVNIIAIKEGESIRVSPGADDVITADAVLVLLGEYAALDRMGSVK